MNKTIAFIGKIICIIAILISLTIITRVKDERKTKIQLLEQSLNEQYEYFEKRAAAGIDSDL